MNVKVVMRKLQGSGKNYQFMLLAGFTAALSHTTALYVETLSPNSLLTVEEIDGVKEKLRKLANAEAVVDITLGAVQKKLDKLFEIAVDC